MFRDWMLRARALLKRSAVESDIDEELRFHIDRQVEWHMARGLSRADAVRRARVEFGGLDQVKEEYRDALGVRLVEGCWRDLRLAVRTLRATPVVTVVAILSLALGIGANTAIFGLINSLIFRPLPVDAPEQLVVLTAGGDSVSYPVWQQLRTHQRLFDGGFAWFRPRLSLTASGEAQMVNGILASGKFFEVLRVDPFLGRAFTEADDHIGGGPGGPVAVLGHDFWRRHYRASPDAIGKQLVIERVSYTIIGVSAPGFFGPDVGRSFDVVLPLNTEPLLRGPDSLLDEPNSRFLSVMFRLRPDQSPRSATAALAAVQPQIRDLTVPPDLSSAARARYLKDPFRLEAAASGVSRLNSWRQPLFLMFAVVGSVLLIACANIANLLLARAAARRHEMSVRVAMGAPRGRLLTQLFTESLLLAGTGAALGLLFSHWASRLLVNQLSTQITRVHLELSVDWRVITFTSALTCGTAVLCGIMPAIRGSRANPNESLLGRSGAAARQTPVASALIIVQVALSLVLLVGAGLFVRTFAMLATLPIGFQTDRLVAATVTARSTQFERASLPELFRRVREAALTVPGAERVAMSRIAPIAGVSSNVTFHLQGGGRLEPAYQAHVNAVSPDWFATLGVRIVRGRDISETDRSGSPRVAVVNEAFVRTFLRGVEPIGQRIVSSNRILELGTLDVVGVVGDAVYTQLREPPPPTIYYALAQFSMPSSVYLFIRSGAGSEGRLSGDITTAMAKVDPRLLLQFRTIDDQIRASLARERLLAIVTTFFGCLGLLLAAVGLFGVTSYAVNRLRPEISIRVAIGASPASILRLVLQNVGVLVGAGIVAGGILTLWLSQFVSAALLYRLEARDLTTLAAAALLLFVVATFAAGLPARWASQIDPAELLRKA